MFQISVIYYNWISSNSKRYCCQHVLYSGTIEINAFKIFRSSFLYFFLAFLNICYKFINYLFCCLIENSRSNKRIFGNLIFLWLNDELEWLLHRWQNLDDSPRFVLNSVSKSFIYLNFLRSLIRCCIICIFFSKSERDLGDKRECYISFFWTSCISISLEFVRPILGTPLVFDENSPDRRIVIMMLLND